MAGCFKLSSLVKRKRAVSNGPIQFKSAPNIGNLLELLAKISRLLVCSCSQKFYNCACPLACSDSTVVDKSLGTNLHLWLFFTRAKWTARREFIYIFSAAPPPPPSTMLDTCTRYFSGGSTLYGGEGGKATHFETENSAFLKLRFKHTEN